MEKKKELVMLGLIDPKGYELDNRVYHNKGIGPTEKSGNARIKVIKKWKKKN